MLDGVEFSIPDKAAQREAWTIGQAANAYLASPDHLAKTTRTRPGEITSLRKHVAHHLGARSLATIDVPMAKRLFRLIEADKRKNKRHRRLGGAGAARKALRLFSAMLSWCVDQG